MYPGGVGCNRTVNAGSLLSRRRKRNPFSAIFSSGVIRERRSFSAANSAISFRISSLSLMSLIGLVGDSDLRRLLRGFRGMFIVYKFCDTAVSYALKGSARRWCGNCRLKNPAWHGLRAHVTVSGRLGVIMSSSWKIREARIKFTEEEDALLIKEEQDLSWEQIKDRFPKRSLGSLRAHYYSKLKARLAVQKKRGRPAWRKRRR